MTVTGGVDRNYKCRIAYIGSTLVHIVKHLSIFFGWSVSVFKYNFSLPQRSSKHIQLETDQLPQGGNLETCDLRTATGTTPWAPNKNTGGNLTPPGWQLKSFKDSFDVSCLFFREGPEVWLIVVRSSFDIIFALRSLICQKCFFQKSQDADRWCFVVNNFLRNKTWQQQILFCRTIFMNKLLFCRSIFKWTKWDFYP